MAATSRVRILGLDPGSLWTGYGILDSVVENGRSVLSSVAHGTLSVKRDEQGDRLLAIHDLLGEVIRSHRPEVLAIERVFFAKNAVSALKLGQARGAALLTARIHGLKVFEYAPTEVKRAVVGHGRADKQEVQKMVKILLGEMHFDSLDASDALSLAICHSRQAQEKGSASPWAQALKEAERSRSKRRGSGFAELMTRRSR